MLTLNMNQYCDHYLLNLSTFSKPLISVSHVIFHSNFGRWKVWRTYYVGHFIIAKIIFLQETLWRNHRRRSDQQRKSWRHSPSQSTVASAACLSVMPTLCVCMSLLISSLWLLSAPPLSTFFFEHDKQKYCPSAKTPCRMLVDWNLSPSAVNKWMIRVWRGCFHGYAGL